MTDDLSRLRPEQRELLAHWIPEAEALADLSWGLVETKVLELVSDQGRLILKAGGVADGHIVREIRAHREWLHPWASTGHAPLVLFGDEAAKMLITRYLPGTLVEGTSAQDDPETYRQAGSLLVTLHGQLSVLDEDWNDRFRARVERHLALPHRIDSKIEGRVRAEVSSWPRGGARVVPTHGDWQPRNWLIDDGVIRISTSDAPTCARRPRTSSVLHVRTLRAIPTWRPRSSRGMAVIRANRRSGGEPWSVKR